MTKREIVIGIGGGILIVACTLIFMFVIQQTLLGIVWPR